MVSNPDCDVSSEDFRVLYGNWIKRIALLLKARMPWADLDELLQWGAIGMLEAMNRFDRTLGVDFKSFAARRVRGAMIDGLRREGALRRGEFPLDVDAADRAATYAGTSPEDALSHLIRSGDQAILISALRSLPPLEYRVISLHFFNDMNNREIASILTISEGYASRIRKRALESLAAHMTAQFDGEAV